MVLIEEQILREVQAGAESELRRAAKHHRWYEVQRAIRSLVESSMPKPSMPSVRIDTIYRGHGDPHCAWKWVTNAGMATLLVELEDWDRLVVSSFVTYPGLSRRPRMVYRDQTAPEQIQLVIEMAVRAI